MTIAKDPLSSASTNIHIAHPYKFSQDSHSPIIHCIYSISPKSTSTKSQSTTNTSLNTTKYRCRSIPVREIPYMIKNYPDVLRESIASITDSTPKYNDNNWILNSTLEQAVELISGNVLKRHQDLLSCVKIEKIKKLVKRLLYNQISLHFGKNSKSDDSSSASSDPPQQKYLPHDDSIKNPALVKTTSQVESAYADTNEATTKHDAEPGKSFSNTNSIASDVSKVTSHIYENQPDQTSRTFKNDDNNSVKVSQKAEKILVNELNVTTDTDLNKLPDDQLALVKKSMDLEFERNRKKPGESGFEYDVVRDFGDPDESNDWDDDDDDESSVTQVIKTDIERSTPSVFASSCPPSVTSVSIQPILQNPNHGVNETNPELTKNDSKTETRNDISDAEIEEEIEGYGYYDDVDDEEDAYASEKETSSEDEEDKVTKNVIVTSEDDKQNEKPTVTLMSTNDHSLPNPVLSNQSKTTTTSSAYTNHTSVSFQEISNEITPAPPVSSQSIDSSSTSHLSSLAKPNIPSRLPPLSKLPASTGPGAKSFLGGSNGTKSRIDEELKISEDDKNQFQVAVKDNMYAKTQEDIILTDSSPVGNPAFTDSFFPLKKTEIVDITASPPSSSPVTIISPQSQTTLIESEQIQHSSSIITSPQPSLTILTANTQEVKPTMNPEELVYDDDDAPFVEEDIEELNDLEEIVEIQLPGALAKYRIADERSDDIDGNTGKVLQEVRETISEQELDNANTGTSDKADLKKSRTNSDSNDGIIQDDHEIQSTTLNSSMLNNILTIMKPERDHSNSNSNSTFNSSGANSNNHSGSTSKSNTTASSSNLSRCNSESKQTEDEIGFRGSDKSNDSGTAKAELEKTGDAHLVEHEITGKDGKKEDVGETNEKILKIEELDLEDIEEEIVFSDDGLSDIEGDRGIGRGASTMDEGNDEW